MWRLLLLMLAALAAPAHAAGLRVALQLEPTSLDPTSGASAAIPEVAYRTIFEGLTALDPTGEPVPLLATGWTRAADGRSYLFRLRPVVRFSDGRVFDAGVARASLLRAARPGSPDPQASALAEIAGIDVLGPLTIRIRLTRPDAALPALLARPGCVMVPPGAGADLSTRPIGTGPFRFAEWRRGDRLRLARNDGYWGAPAQLDGIEFRFIADPAAAYAAVTTHAVDVFPDYPAPENMAALARDRSLAVSTRPSEGEVILALNNRWGPLRDVRVRRAIAHALDRRAIIGGAMFGYGQPIGSHFPPQRPGYVDLTARYPYDPARARALLAAAGYPHGFAATLALPPPSYARRSGEIVAAQLRAIGIAVTLRPVEWPQWLDQVFGRHAYQMSIVNHAEPEDYDIYARPDYYFGGDGRAVAALLDQLQGANDPARQRALLGAIQQRIADDAVNGFLFEFPHLRVADAGLRDLWANAPYQALDYARARWASAPARDGEQSGRTAPWGWIAIVAAALLAVLALRVTGPAALLARLLVLGATLIGTSLLVFFATQALPGDPAQFMLGVDASPQAVAALRAELGLGGGLGHRYFTWAARLMQGDLGTSYSYGVPVAGLIGPRLAVSLPLAALATALASLLGLAAAILGARRPEGLADRALGFAARLGLAVPSFWLAALLLLLFAVRLRWVAASGFPGWDAGFGPALGALALPILALALPQAAVIARVGRAALEKELGLAYVRLARAKGLAERQVLLRHALPNAWPPILAVIGLQFPFLLAGSVIVEQVFGLPGLGRLVLDAVAGRDLPLVAAVALLFAAAAVLASFAADLAQRAADPRLRACP